MPANIQAVPRFAFSRRDPAAILDLAEKRRQDDGAVCVLALGGQPRDRVYFAQLLAESAGQAFVQVDIGLAGRSIADEQGMLDRLFALARVTPSTLFIDGAETLFADAGESLSARAQKLGGHVRNHYPGSGCTLVLGMPEKVEPDFARLPASDLVVTFRAPSGSVITGRPVLLPSRVVDQELLPAHNFHVAIDGVDAGMCAVSAPALTAGPYSEQDFDPTRGVEAFAGLEREQRAAWPTLTLRRAVTQSKLFFDWKHAQYAGKPLLRDVEINQMDWANTRVTNTWVVRGCWARAWTGPSFDALQAEVAVESLALYYQHIDWR